VKKVNIARQQFCPLRCQAAIVSALSTKKWNSTGGT